MTEKRFFELFKGIASPECRGAPYPKFDPAKINESMFADELRCKSYQFDFRQGREGGDDELIVRWTSQNWAETDTFVHEVRRCLVHIGFVGRVKILMNQRGYGVYTECGARRRFVLRKGAKDMKKDRKDTSIIEVMADLCGIPRKKLAKDIKYNSHSLWVMKEPKNDLYLFRGQEGGYFLGTVVSLILGNEFVFAHTKEVLEKNSSVKNFTKEYEIKLKPVRITVEIKECKGGR